MHLHKALKADPARLAVFRALCTPDALSGAVLARLKRHPLFAGVELPSSIAHLRIRYDCEGQRGGLRPMAAMRRVYNIGRPVKGVES